MPIETIARPTSGPWTLETVKTSVGVCHKIGSFPKRVSVTDGERTYACVYEDGSSAQTELQRGTLDSELLANARLMAAAPDLLEALKTTAGNIRSLGPAGALTQVPMEYREWLRVVDAAIARAEGRA